MKPVELDACPSCQRPLDSTMRRTNVRTVQGKTVLSCAWCWKVITIEPDGRRGNGGFPMPRKALSGWTKTTPTKEGWYWYRDAHHEVVLHVFEPHARGHWKAWDWSDGRLMLCAIADYEGEWYGPMKAPP